MPITLLPAEVGRFAVAQTRLAAPFRGGTFRCIRNQTPPASSSYKDATGSPGLCRAHVLPPSHASRCLTLPGNCGPRWPGLEGQGPRVFHPADQMGTDGISPLLPDVFPASDGVEP